MIRPPLALRIAARDLRGGLQGFRVFILCLMLGVAAISAVGTLREGIRRGLDDQGAVLLGGDAQAEFSYRFASASERAWLEARATALSEVVDFRSMAVVGEERALTQVKAVDAAYPLTGQMQLEPDMPLDQALAGRDGLPGAVMDPVLIDRLGLAPGDRFRLGQADFVLMARILREPDSAAGGFGLGPRTLLRSADLQASGLLQPGSVFETEYRLLLPPGHDLDQIRAQAEAAWRDRGMSWQDRRRGAPGAERFVERMGSFLVLVGLAGLAVGGVGVAAAVRAHLDRKTESIAILKALGATGGVIFAAYGLQIGLLSLLGVGLGLVIGGTLPVLAAPLVAARLPIPVDLGLAPLALAEAALYGLLTAALFTLWPLSRLAEVRAAALFRDLGPGRRALPRPAMLVAMALVLAALVGAAIGLAQEPRLAMGTLGGVAAALAVLSLAALGLSRLARALAPRARGKPGLRLALAAIGGPRSEAGPVILSLGLGLAVLAATGQIEANLRAAIDRDLPDVAPSYFFVDIQPDQIAGFLDRVKDDPAVSRVETAPMLRGILTQINGRDAREQAGSHWVVNGDRGITYADLPPARTTVTEGRWWPPGYDGPPQVSVAAAEAAEIGLKLGDRLTINILGRDIEAEVTSFRAVDFSTAGIGFVLLLNSQALAGAPHTHIATVYADAAAEARILRDLARDYPNITAIRIRDAIDRVAEALTAIARATAIAAAGTLVTGFVVLIGAAAAGERGRVYEAALLKVLGATRGRILASFAARSAMMGAAAGLVAVAFGAAAGWAVMVFVMEGSFRFEPVSALAIVVGGALVTLLAGLAFALRPLAVRPARILRARD